MTIRETKQHIEQDPKYWLIPFMEFVDDFRRYRDFSLIQEPFELTDERFDALLASTVEYLCDELNMEPPEWVWNVPSCQDPWFVSGLENLKAITIVESPVYFRRRKIFVLENFLARV
jgi:hypothetical protein